MGPLLAAVSASAAAGFKPTLEAAAEQPYITGTGAVIVGRVSRNHQGAPNMLTRSLFPRDLFAEMDRVTRELQQSFDLSPSIRGFARGGYPALNVGSTSSGVEIYAFAPGMDPARIEVNLDRGVLTIAGERPATAPSGDEKTTLHVNERFAGRFRRVISLPDDIDPNGVSADYRDGVLHVSVKRRASAQPRRIEVQ
jgi:HSP20 family protein